MSWVDQYSDYIRFDPGTGVLTFLAPRPVAEVSCSPKETEGPIPEFWMLNERNTTPNWEILLKLSTKQNPLSKEERAQSNERLTLRLQVADWMFAISQSNKLSRNTFGLAVNYYDRYLTKAETDNIYLLGAACLFIASKFENVRPISTDELVEWSNNVFSKEDIITQEENVLSTLDWVLVHKPCSMFLDALLNALPQELKTNAKFVHLCNFLCDASMLMRLTLKMALTASHLASSILVHVAVTLRMGVGPVNQLIRSPPLNIEIDKSRWERLLTYMKTFHKNVFGNETDYESVKREYSQKRRADVAMIDPSSI